jgi:nucleotide-binding universal stress UspA family protein
MYPFLFITLMAATAAAPSTAGVQLLQVLGALLLLTTFALLAARLLSEAIRAYTVQSLVLALVAAVVGYYTHSFDLYIVAALTVVVKCGVIPWILRNVMQRLHVQREIRLYLGIPASLLGSTADKLVNHTPYSVLVVCSKGGKALFRRLLVGLDGSPLSWQAFQVGLQLAKLSGATLATLSVIEGPKTPPKQQAATKTSSGKLDWDWAIYFQQAQALAAAQAHIADLPVETYTREGSASTLLTSLAQERKSDLLILGSTGHEHPLSSTTGGTARKVANAAPCAVLLVRPLTFQDRVRDLMTQRVRGQVA